MSLGLQLELRGERCVGVLPAVRRSDLLDVLLRACKAEPMLMNSVPAGVAGTITEAYAARGDLVEFGQPLFRVGVEGAP